MDTFPFEITGMYPLFYTQPNATGTAGTSYSFSGTLPRPVATGESVILIPAAQRWGLVDLTNVTAIGWTFALHCVVNTTLMSSKWSAIYYKAH